MLNIHNIEQAKQTARALERALKASGIDIALGQAMDIVSRIEGVRDFNALAKKYSKASIDRGLAPHELSHAAGSQGANYGAENALVTHTGFELRYDANPFEELSYVRVCDPLGREVGYWLAQEVQEDPELVLGAILGALARGKPVELQDGRRKKLTKDGGVQSATKEALTTILDVDFSFLTAVIIDGEHRRVMNVDADELKRLPQLFAQHSAGEDLDDEGAAVAVTFDDFVCVSLAELAELKWDEAKECFMSPAGAPWEFIFAVTLKQMSRLKERELKERLDV